MHYFSWWEPKQPHIPAQFVRTPCWCYCCHWALEHRHAVHGLVTLQGLLEVTKGGDTGSFQLSANQFVGQFELQWLTSWSAMERLRCFAKKDIAVSPWIFTRLLYIARRKATWHYNTRLLRAPYDSVHVLLPFSVPSFFFLNFSWMSFLVFQWSEEKPVVCSANWNALCAFSAAVLLKFRVPRLELPLLNARFVPTSRAAHAELVGVICAVHSPQPTRHIVCLYPCMIHPLQQRQAQCSRLEREARQCWILGAAIEAVWIFFSFFLVSTYYVWKSDSFVTVVIIGWHSRLNRENMLVL